MQNSSLFVVFVMLLNWQLKKKKNMITFRWTFKKLRKLEKKIFQPVKDSSALDVLF